MKELILSVTRSDFVVETKRGHGPGGQNKNKRETAVRITHPESGAVGFSQDERSQLQNRNTAFHRLIDSQKFQEWLKQKTKLGTDNTVNTNRIRTYNESTHIVKDDRLDKTFNFEKIIDGQIDEMLKMVAIQCE